MTINTTALDIGWRQNPIQTSLFNIDPVAIQYFNGVDPCEPEPVVRDTITSALLTRDVDYGLSWSNNAAVGTGYVTATGMVGSAYEGCERTQNFEIAPNEFRVEAIAKQLLHGVAACEPHPVVRLPTRDTILVEGTDYTLEWSDNTSVGTGTVTVKGAGTYATFKNKSATFTILAPAYTDGCLGTDDALVGRYETADTVTYVFTNGTDHVIRLGATARLMDALVVGGGAAGCQSGLSGDQNGGGGGGKVAETNFYLKAIAANEQIHLTIGAGGAAGNPGKAGGASSLVLSDGTISAAGGTGGSRNTGKGGDGARTAGHTKTTTDCPGRGGEGVMSVITGERHVYGSGGAAGMSGSATTLGGEESGGNSVGTTAYPGVNGLGGGGAGGYSWNNAGKGGSGAVIIRFSLRNESAAFDAKLPRTEYLRTGSAICPEPVVTIPGSSTVLTKNTDYTLSYSSNTDLGVGRVTVIGAGAYAGRCTVCDFAIREPAYTDEWLMTSDASVTVKDFGTERVYIFTNCANFAEYSYLFRKDAALSELLVVAGGGSGNSGPNGSCSGGGGGGGGVIYRKSDTLVTIPALAERAVVVGYGSIGYGQRGRDSVLGLSGETLTAFGGSGGTGGSTGVGDQGVCGSTGGQGNRESMPTATLTPTQGCAGGSAGNDDKIGGGGGGATEAGHASTAVDAPAQGGRGFESTITGERHVYGSGGAGGRSVATQGGEESGGGCIGGVGQNGVNGLGGGGGGAHTYLAAGNGGSGIVAIRILTTSVTGLFEVELPRSKYVYLGSAITPAPTVGVKDDPKTLVAGQDYSVSYVDNVAVGVATVNVTGLGSYDGYFGSAQFAIVQPQYSDEYLASTDASVRIIDFARERVYIFTNCFNHVTNTTAIRKGLTLRECLVVGGGGAGGGGNNSNTFGGGGGGGGVIYRGASQRVVLSQGFQFDSAVGRGGVGRGTRGFDSVLTLPNETLTAFGGGGGASWDKHASAGGIVGSSGGNSGNNGQYTSQSTPTEGQGTAGGTGKAGGGGGATEAGHAWNAAEYPRQGGMGFASTITGERHVYGSGGAGAAESTTIAGGEESGGGCVSNDGQKGVNGLGGGGGACYAWWTPGNGGSGCVILRIRKPAGFTVIVK